MEFEPGRGILLFVYGTMLSRGRNHSRLYEHRAIRIGDTYRTRDLFNMYLRSKNGAPCAVPALNGFPIEGELYAACGEAVEAIDGFEGSPFLYERHPVKLTGFGGAAVEMYRYVRPLNADSGNEQPVEPDADLVLRYRP